MNLNGNLYHIFMELIGNLSNEQITKLIESLQEYVDNDN